MYAWWNGKSFAIISLAETAERVFEGRRSVIARAYYSKIV